MGDFWVIPAAGGVPRRLTSDSAEGGGLAWLPEGLSLIVSSGRRGGRTLWRVPLDGGEPEPVTTGAGSDLDPELARDGSHLVYTNARRSYVLMLLDPATGAQHPVLERRLQINGSSFSPDGQRLAFFMMTDELEHIFTVGTDGKGLHQVTKGQRAGNIMPHWSSDGTAIYFYQELGQPSFRKVPVNGGPSTTVIDGWQWPVQNSARWDPQDRRLAYALFEQGRLKATLLREIATGKDTPLQSTLYPVEWSPDGQRLVGIEWRPDANIGEADGDVLVCSAAGGPCQRVGQGRFATWSGDGSRIYVERNRKVLDDPWLCSVEVWVMAPDGSGARRLAVLEPEIQITSEIAVSRNDQIAWVQFRRGQEELWLAELGPVSR
jgi:Tol biopolymer transport system component